MYTLFWSPGSASMASHVLLEELGVPYELSRVELNKPRDAAFLKLNPWGRVPTLVADGKAMYESAAICMHLTDRHPEKGLAPAVGTMDRAYFYQWLLFLATHCERHVRQMEEVKSDPAFPHGLGASARCVTLTARE